MPRTSIRNYSYSRINIIHHDIQKPLCRDCSLVVWTTGGKYRGRRRYKHLLCTKQGSLCQSLSPPGTRLRLEHGSRCQHHPSGGAMNLATRLQRYRKLVGWLQGGDRISGISGSKHLWIHQCFNVTISEHFLEVSVSRLPCPGSSRGCCHPRIHPPRSLLLVSSPQQPPPDHL